MAGRIMQKSNNRPMGVLSKGASIHWMINPLSSAIILLSIVFFAFGIYVSIKYSDMFELFNSILLFLSVGLIFILIIQIIRTMESEVIEKFPLIIKYFSIFIFLSFIFILTLIDYLHRIHHVYLGLIYFAIGTILIIFGLYYIKHWEILNVNNKFIYGQIKKRFFNKIKEIYPSVEFSTTSKATISSRSQSYIIRIENDICSIIMNKSGIIEIKSNKSLENPTFIFIKDLLIKMIQNV